MATEHTTSWSLILIAGAAGVALGLVIVFGKVDGLATGLMSGLLCGTARTAVELLFTLLPAAWRALEAHAFDHHWLSPSALDMAATFWSLLHVVAGAA
jgi:hypothetical protein